MFCDNENTNKDIEKLNLLKKFRTHIFFTAIAVLFLISFGIQISNNKIINHHQQFYINEAASNYSSDLNTFKNNLSLIKRVIKLPRNNLLCELQLNAYLKHYTANFIHFNTSDMESSPKQLQRSKIDYNNIKSICLMEGEVEFNYKRIIYEKKQI